MHRLDFLNDKSLSKISVHTTYRPNSYLSKICLHRINGLVVCSSCEQKSNPPVYAPAPYKETAEDLAMKEMIRKKKEEAPKKIMAEMKQMMVSKPFRRFQNPVSLIIFCCRMSFKAGKEVLSKK